MSFGEDLVDFRQSVLFRVKSFEGGIAGVPGIAGIPHCHPAQDGVKGNMKECHQDFVTAGVMLRLQGRPA